MPGQRLYMYVWLPIYLSVEFVIPTVFAFFAGRMRFDITRNSRDSLTRKMFSAGREYTKKTRTNACGVYYAAVYG